MSLWIACEYFLAVYVISRVSRFLIKVLIIPGLKRAFIFPEIEYDKLPVLRNGYTFVIKNTKNVEQARGLVKYFSMPFKDKEEK